RLSHILYGGRGEPTKFPTGESTFINMRIRDVMATGYTTAKSTFLLESQREGLSKEDLILIKRTGLLNRLLFPKLFLYSINSDKKVTGGQDQMNSNLIFCFAHGSYNLFEHGDVLIDARGFPFITPLTRIYPPIRSGLSAKGAFDVRGVESMQYGPSVVFVVSCITGRTDGLRPENTISQAFLHAGVNAYIGATRVTADPGYLEPRPLPGGWGIGLLGFLKASLNLLIKNQYPDFHFGAVIGEDFVKELIEEDATTGMALRNAKNVYLPKDANSTFLWTPPLMFTTGSGFIDQMIQDEQYQSNPLGGAFQRTKVLDKKYVAFHEFTLYGDPAFNPYQSMNP
ncbi:MAG: C25 family cysteine peptidase, partial [Candidatus Thermoplasmatota archaeon]|nr:C25 family cysteine peptidase [Candidatus Thermoplasmatota archaeon]